MRLTSNKQFDKSVLKWLHVETIKHDEKTSRHIYHFPDYSKEKYNVHNMALCANVGMLSKLLLRKRKLVGRTKERTKGDKNSIFFAISQ